MLFKRLSIKLSFFRGYVSKYPVYHEKCLYNFYLSEQTFKVRSTSSRNLGSGRLKTRLTENLDDIDLQIVILLQEDSRLSFNKIARKVGISVGTAYNRVKNLEALGVLKGYTVTLDPFKLGYGLTAIIMIQAEGGHLAEVEQEIAKNANVIAIYDITGDYDAAVVTKFKDRSSLNDFVKSLLATPYIKRTVTSVALDVIKEEYRINLCYA
jgi:Lrp/AsnC family transcriptional regulator for asnA, asnC and gidA